MSVSIFGDGRIEGIPLNKKIASFTASGTWTVPAGVTYAIAHMMGGGGGIGVAGSGGDGGDSSVAFAGGTVTSKGRTKQDGPSSTSGAQFYAGKDGIGENASARRFTAGEGPVVASTNVFTVAGDSVTPGGSVTVTVGAGGAAGTGGLPGGSGYVYIEYYE